MSSNQPEVLKITTLNIYQETTELCESLYNMSYLVSTHGRMGGFPGGGRGRNLLVSCSGIKVALTGRGILLLLPDEEDRERGSSPPQSDLEPRSEESLSLGKAQGRLSQDRDGEGEWVGEPGTGLLQR